jgi:hypothetical protein
MSIRPPLLRRVDVNAAFSTAASTGDTTMIRRNLATLAVMAGTVLAAIALASSPQAPADASIYFGCMVSGQDGAQMPAPRADHPHESGG